MFEFQDYTLRRLTPEDQNGTPTAAGTAGNSSALAADDTWQAVVVPVECKRVAINCDDGSAAYDHIASPQEFHFCFNSAGTGRRATSSIDLSIEASAGSTVGYVKAAAGLIFSITLLA